MSDARFIRLARAAATMHSGQVDGQGVPYIRHLMAVADGVPDDAKIVALFHDSIEDGKATVVDLRRVGLTATEILAVRLLSRPDGFDYDAYIARLLVRDDEAGRLARLVKVSDLRHNVGRLVPALERLRPRYERALELLG